MFDSAGQLIGNAAPPSDVVEGELLGPEPTELLRETYDWYFNRRVPARRSDMRDVTPKAPLRLEGDQPQKS